MQWPLNKIHNKQQKFGKAYLLHNKNNNKILSQSVRFLLTTGAPVQILVLLRRHWGRPVIKQLYLYKIKNYNNGFLIESESY